MIIPPLLKQGSKVRIVAPSGKLPSDKSLDKAIQELTEWGLTVVVADHVFNNHNLFSASDTYRLNDFQSALNDPTVDLILCARGGYGITRILDDLDLAGFVKEPKWVVGFSDITAFLQKAYQLGVATIHGPMGTSFSRKGVNESIEALKQLVFRGESVIKTDSKQLRLGSGKGELIGGNLAMICDSIGTSSEIDTTDKILVLEDVGEYYYRVDRMLTQLKRANKLFSLKGLAIGSFSSMSDGDTPFGEEVNNMVARLTEEYNYPVAIDMPIGHEPANFPFVFGAEYVLDVNKSGAKLKLVTKL